LSAISRADSSGRRNSIGVVERSEGVVGGYRWVRPDERARIAARLGAGGCSRELALEFGCSTRTVLRIGEQAALAGRRVAHSPRRLFFEERERISRGIAAGESDSEIARALGRHRSTVGREIRAACAERGRYRALAAERKSRARGARPKATKLSASRRLLAAVEAGLERRWSPQQVSARLKLEHPDDGEMRISHETIYRSLYVQSRGELRRQLSANLRSGRSRRRAQGRADHRGQIVGMVSIAERPPEIEDRAVPGHWEGDLLIGAGGRSAIATLVERQTRYVLLASLPNGRTTLEVIEALKRRIQDLPSHLMRSLTWDQGRELAGHRAFTIDTGVEVYFCDPHSPWQRGSNENTNGLLRQYLPRTLDLAARSQIELDRIAAELNGRPRETLQWQTPVEKMNQLLLR
jgi:transposase, IS30 family